MGNYGRTTDSGAAQTAAITNDDKWTLDLPEVVDDSKFDPGMTKDPRSY